MWPIQGTVVAIENPAANLYGLQYHPEVQHSERGIATLRRFLFDISKVPADWKIENVLDEEMAKIRATVSVIHIKYYYKFLHHSQSLGGYLRADP